MQFIQSMNVVDVVNPRQIRMIADGVNFIFSFFIFSPLFFGAACSIGGNGRNARNIPSMMIIAAVAINIVLNGRLFTATKLIANGSRNCAIDIESFVNIFAIVPFSLNISIHEGVILVSRNEFAIPLMIAST